jgi:hypothetical protein
MTPKEQYEQRKAARIAARDKPFRDESARDEETVDLLDRFVTAVERIADALEGRTNV